MKNGLKAMLAILAILIASVSLLAAIRSYVKAATDPTTSGTPTPLSSYGTIVLFTSAGTTGGPIQIFVASSTVPFYVEKLLINQKTGNGVALTAVYATISLPTINSGRFKTGTRVCFLAAFATSNVPDPGPPADLIQTISGSSLVANSPLAGVSIENGGALFVNLWGDSACTRLVPALDTIFVQADVVAPSSATVTLTLTV